MIAAESLGFWSSLLRTGEFRAFTWLQAALGLSYKEQLGSGTSDLDALEIYRLETAEVLVVRYLNLQLHFESHYRKRFENRLA